MGRTLENREVGRGCPPRFSGTAVRSARNFGGGGGGQPYCLEFEVENEYGGDDDGAERKSRWFGFFAGCAPNRSLVFPDLENKVELLNLKTT